jgi:hypothetical protein
MEDLYLDVDMDLDASTSSSDPNPTRFVPADRTVACSTLVRHTMARVGDCERLK